MQSDSRVELIWSSDSPYWDTEQYDIRGVFEQITRRGLDRRVEGRPRRLETRAFPASSRQAESRCTGVRRYCARACSDQQTGTHSVVQASIGSDENLCRQYVAEVVSRHSDQAMANILPRVGDFAQRLIHAERSMTEDYVGLCGKRFRVDLNDSTEKVKALLEHNAFVCTKPPSGRHLTTGHIFEAFDDSLDLSVAGVRPRADPDRQGAVGRARRMAAVHGRKASCRRQGAMAKGRG